MFLQVPSSPAPGGSPAEAIINGKTGGAGRLAVSQCLSGHAHLADDLSIEFRAG